MTPPNEKASALRHEAEAVYDLLNLRIDRLAEPFARVLDPEMDERTAVADSHVVPAVGFPAALPIEHSARQHVEAGSRFALDVFAGFDDVILAAQRFVYQYLHEILPARARPVPPESAYIA